MAHKRHHDRLSSLAAMNRHGSVFVLDGRTVVKMGDNVFHAEAETMRFIRENTSIPVPKVRKVFRDKQTKHLAIAMQYIEGATLEDVWQDLEDIDRDTVVEQLRCYMDELRNFKGTFIGSIDGTVCNDPYFYHAIGGNGPFPDENEFNQGIVEAMRDDRSTCLLEKASELWLKNMNGHESVLTHNDLEPRNILIDGSEVVGILDWENAGYYPEYWEYCKTLRRANLDSPFIASGAVDRVLTPYLRELSVFWSCNEVFY